MYFTYNELVSYAIITPTTSHGSQLSSSFIQNISKATKKAPNPKVRSPKKQKVKNHYSVISTSLEEEFVSSVSFLRLPWPLKRSSNLASAALAPPTLFLTASLKAR